MQYPSHRGKESRLELGSRDSVWPERRAAFRLAVSSQSASYLISSNRGGLRHQPPRFFFCVPSRVAARFRDSRLMSFSWRPHDGSSVILSGVRTPVGRFQAALLVFCAELVASGCEAIRRAGLDGKQN